MRSPVKNILHKKDVGNRSRLSLAQGVGIAIVFVTFIQVFFVFVKPHHVEQQNNAIVTHRNSPGQRDRLHAPPGPANVHTHAEAVYNHANVLPSFSNDKSDYIFSSLIERTSGSWALHITTFFLSMSMIDPEGFRGYKANMLNMDYYNDWKELISKQDSIIYDANGARSRSTRYSCRLEFPFPPYEMVSIGRFMPNRQTLDSNSNRRLDVLRCPMTPSAKLYKALVASPNATIHVELLREEKSLISFVIPIKSRRTGYLFSGPSAASELEAWKGLDTRLDGRRGASEPSVPPQDSDVLHVCAARSRNTYGTVEKLFQYLEFIEHHVMLGASHIYLSVDYSWNSSSMRHILRTLGQYIDSGKLTIMSEANEVNMLSSTSGILWDYVAVRNFQINSCLYLAKGSATYLAVWDVSEFFVPGPLYTSILEVIHSASVSDGRDLHPSDAMNGTTVETWRGGPGWADGEAHPYCYLSIGVRRVYASSTSDQLPSNHRYMANIYEKSPVFTTEYTRKTILPTRQIYQGALQVAGVCRLGTEWTPCAAQKTPSTADNMCFVQIEDEFYAHNQFIAKKNPVSVPAVHAVDDVVFERDSKKLGLLSDGYLIEFALPSEERKLLKRNNAAVVGDTGNKYIEKYSAVVRAGIGQHVSDLTNLGPIPERHPSSILSSKWKPFNEVFPKPPPESESDLTKISVAQQNQTSGVSEMEFAFDIYDIFKGSSNGPLNFTEEFARGDILQRPATGLLPAFASDYSDIGLGSIIEREHDSWNLFVTTFFLQHWMLWKPPDNYGMSRVSPINRAKWEKVSGIFNETQYAESGARKSNGRSYICRLRVSKDAEPYDVIGHFMPNALTPDRNANRRVDIMRCQMPDSMRLYHVMPKSNESIHVEIVRSNVILFEFSVPWKTRRTGYTLSSPDMAVSFNAWKGFDPDIAGALPGTIGGDQLYMCVPGVESALSRLTIPRYAEFIQHHYLLGVQHMFVGGTYAWNGQNMATLLTAFQSYIDEGRMTVSSLAGDNIDLLYSILGASLDRDNAKVMHVNMCLYLSKGVADYVAVWDTDEYFIPKLPHHTIMDVIRSAEAPEPLQPLPTDTDVFAMKSMWRGGRGWADGHAHPFCYMTLSSDCIFRKEPGTKENMDKVSWVGEDFSHQPDRDRRGLSFQKSILPTRIIFQAGLHVGAACRLPSIWAGCNRTFCYTTSTKDVYGYSVEMRDGVKKAVDFSLLHKFDSVVFDKDAKRINPNTEALIYHIQIYRAYITAGEKALSSPEKNEYAIRFFPAVMNELKRRGIHVLVTLPEKVNSEHAVPPDSKWIQMWPTIQQHVLSRTDVEIKMAKPSPNRFYGVEGQLPYFAIDHSDVILGSIIERTHESHDLHLVTFFIAHEQLANHTGKIKNTAVRADGLNAWMKAIKHSRGVTYNQAGERDDGHNYTCVMTNTASGLTYTVKGSFMPNELTPDVNANKRLDILRCPIMYSKQAYDILARSDEKLLVRIRRDTHSVAHFFVPWKARRTGFMLSDPPDMSRLDVWKGSNSPTGGPIRNPKDFKTDTVHLCVTGVESAMSRRTVARYAEFMQHHFNVGVQHIYVAPTYSAGGVNMERFVGAFRSYIDDGLLSVTSAAGDEDMLYGFFGMSMDRDNVNIFFVNMCLYLSRGVADYLAIWNIDDFFIPKTPYIAIADVIRRADADGPLTTVPVDVNALQKKWKGGKGWADGDGHPLCFFLFPSKVVYYSDKSTFRNRRFGTRFNAAEETSTVMFNKVILPTRRIFQAALNVAGGCKLDPPFSGCDYNDFCYSTKPMNRTEDGAAISAEWSAEHRFDELVLEKDAKKIDAESEAILYHFEAYYSRPTSPSDASYTNDYTKYWFPKVIEGIRSRGLELLQSVPAKLYDAGAQPDHTWVPWREMYWNVALQEQKQLR